MAAEQRDNEKMNGTLPPTDSTSLAALEALLEALIPPSADGRLPGAGSLSLAQTVAEGLARSAESQRQLDRLLAAFAARTAQQGSRADAAAEALAALAAEAPQAFEAIYLEALTAYYQHPQVCQALGLRPGPPFPRGYELEESDLEALLEPVKRRGGPAGLR
ncbi:MAG: hypothetical protein D6815_08405 [Candidatus Dadabacteria bacterium]|nr:MAG: hypothetical protein D6815_08405 [Candidatus Dadabacteria bacterium]